MPRDATLTDDKMQGRGKGSDMLGEGHQDMEEEGKAWTLCFMLNMHKI